MRRLLIIPLAAVAAVALIPAGAASAKTTRCNGTRGAELAKSKIVKIYKVKQGSKYRFYGCAKPRGPVIALTQTFTGNAVKLISAKGAFAAFTRTIRGSDTIAAVDARTGKKTQGLFPPSDIEFDVDPKTRQIGAAKVSLKGELAVAYIGLGNGLTTDTKTIIYGFGPLQNYDGTKFAEGPSKLLPAKSLKLGNNLVSWTYGGVAKSTKFNSYGLSIGTDGGNLEGDVTTTPDNGIACHITKDVATGSCFGSFDPGRVVTVTATGPAASTVTLSGACTANQGPTPGAPANVVTCQVTMDDYRSIDVKISS